MIKKIFFASPIISLYFINPVYSLDSSLSDKSILNMILKGNYNVNTKSISHKLPKDIIQKFKIENVNDFKTNIILNQSFSQNGKSKQMIVTQTRDETSDCHSCAPIIGVSVLDKSGNGWKVSEPFNYIERIGTWGQAPKPSIVEVGKENYGLIFNSGYSNMGMTTNTTSIIGKVNNKYKVLHDENDSYLDNLGSCGKEVKRDCYKYDSKLKFIKNNTLYYPITFTYSGTKPDNNDKAIKYYEVKKYSFYKDKYVKSK